MRGPEYRSSGHIAIAGRPWWPRLLLRLQMPAPWRQNSRSAKLLNVRGATLEVLAQPWGAKRGAQQPLLPMDFQEASCSQEIPTARGHWSYG